MSYCHNRTTKYGPGHKKPSGSSSLSLLPVSGDGDVGGREGLPPRRRRDPPLRRPEVDVVVVVGRLRLSPWVPEVQVHEAARRLPVGGRAVGRAGPLQGPGGTAISVVPESGLEGLKKRRRKESHTKHVVV